MKLIIAGSRSISDYNTLHKAMDLSPYLPLVREVVSGNASGADRLGERYARDHNLTLNLFPARWETNGRSAGMLRNAEMAAYADSLLSLWDGDSRGTANMIHTMRARGKPYFVYCPKQDTHFSGNLIHLTTFPLAR